MRLDDLRAKTPCIHGSMAVHFVDDDPDQRCEPRHTPVSRAEVLQAALTEPCPYCYDWTQSGEDSPNCERCDNRRWLRIEGVGARKSGRLSQQRFSHLVVPLSMLEGDAT